MVPTEVSPQGSSSRADLHCHSTASQVSKLGIQRSLGLPECATPPQEVYELAKRRGMDFVTITDHDTIAGCLELADRPDCFISEELTANFRGEPRAVHVLCYGITPDDHEWLQAHCDDVEVCADYLHEQEITCALAHPFYAVEAQLTPGHRRRLAQLFPIWEVRNGSRARELNMPAATYIDTHGGTGVGGSDDHAGVDIGRTFTEVPAATTPEQFLRRIRAGEAEARGDQGSAAKWAHAAMALAIRVHLLDGEERHETAPDPLAVLQMAQRVIEEGGERRGAERSDLGPEHGRALLAAWLDAMELAEGGNSLNDRAAALLARMQEDGFSHRDLYRRAQRAHERAVREAVSTGGRALAEGAYTEAAGAVFRACIPAVPYAPAAAFLGREKARLSVRDSEPPRVALIADGIGAMHGVTHTLEQIRERGVPGFQVEVVGTDPRVDRRLPAAAELQTPMYEGLALGVPQLPALVEELAEGHYDLVHVSAPGPAGIAAALVARMMGLPLIGSYHTQFGAYARMRSGDPAVEAIAQAALATFYRAHSMLLSPSPAADASLRELGVEQAAIRRWERGVDTARFNPSKRTPAARRERSFKVLYAGRLSREKGVEELADAFLTARRNLPNLQLVLAGGGPEETELRNRLGSAATFLGWLDGEDLAQAYANADLFLFCSRTDTFGQVIVEAQASGLPVVAVDEGGPASLIEHGRSGFLCPADAQLLAGAVMRLAVSQPLRRRIATAGLAAAQERSWERSLEQLAAAWAGGLGQPATSLGQSGLGLAA